MDVYVSVDADYRTWRKDIRHTLDLCSPFVFYLTQEVPSLLARRSVPQAQEPEEAEMEPTGGIDEGGHCRWVEQRSTFGQIEMHSDSRLASAGRVGKLSRFGGSAKSGM